MSSRPANHDKRGGMTSRASVRSNSTSAEVSERSQAPISCCSSAFGRAGARCPLVAADDSARLASRVRAEGAVDRCRAHVQRKRSVLGCPVEHIPQISHSSLPCRRCLDAARNASSIVSLDVTIASGSTSDDGGPLSRSDRDRAAARAVQPAAADLGGGSAGDDRSVGTHVHSFDAGRRGRHDRDSV